ncbi:unnamed protein product [Blepharisma stoltei]|uniref:USP domain-containing protein n=1 Tax=Blepharisma stoltei TaxID=1481888 RepID=A0AAU9JBR6_9CILI|nr:unnamed protein product [Blepharisma stoltei]
MGSGCCKDVEREEKNAKDASISVINTRTDEGEQEIYTIIQDNYLTIPNTFNSDKFNKSKDIGVSGLENLGNTCYINSVLQCLFNCQPLMDYFLSGVHIKDLNILNQNGNRRAVTLAFAELANAYWTKSYDVMVPRFFVKSIWNTIGAITPRKENDAYELLLALLNLISEDLNRANKIQLMSPLKSNKTSELKAAQAWQEELDKNSSIVVDLFQGQLRSTVSCTECNFASQTFEIFFSLSLAIPNKEKPISIDDCLELFTRPEELDKPWCCPRCKHEVKAIKKIDLWKVPPILIIHLKRKEIITKRNQVKEQLFDRASSKIDIAQWVSAFQRENPVYEMFAKINYESNLKSRHYTATVRHKNNQTWQFFDDSDAYYAEEEPLLDKDSYVLFYQRVTGNAYYRQSKNMPKYWPHLVANHLNRVVLETLEP